MVGWCAQSVLSGCKVMVGFERLFVWFVLKVTVSR